MGFKKPVWVEQGPGPLSQPFGTYNLSAGAVQAIAVDPVNPDRVFVASVGGGVWRSLDALSSPSPSWEPLTDLQNSLSMSAIAMSPNDPNRNTVYAGTGGTSHSDPIVGGAHGPTSGLLKTRDGGDSWSEIGRSEFEGDLVTRILPVNQPGIPLEQERVLVTSVVGGLRISNDGGGTWKVSPNVSTSGTDVAADPSQPARVYIAAQCRVYRSEDAAVTDWHEITPPDWIGISASFATYSLYSVRLSVSPAADASGNDWLYAVATKIGSGSFQLAAEVSVEYTPDHGVTWYAAGTPPGGAAPIAPIAVSPLSPDTFLCVTVAPAPNHWLATVAPGQATQWALVESSGANGTAPHVDARDMTFVPDGGVMFETNDGGVYRLTNPLGLNVGPPRLWTEGVGNLRVTEFHAIAYDSVNHTIFGAAQDNGVPHQTEPGGVDWKFNENPAKDGYGLAVDNTTIPGASIHYSAFQYLYNSVRVTFTWPAQPSGSQTFSPVIANTGGLTYNKLEGNLSNYPGLGGSTVQPNQNWANNRVDPTRFLLGTSYLYESFDGAQTFTSLGGLTTNGFNPIIPVNPVGPVSAYLYGHPGNPDIIYIGANGQLMLRTGSSGLPTVVSTFPGGEPYGIAFDSDDWRIGYVIDYRGKVLRTADAGATAEGWDDITGNLGEFTVDLRAIVCLPRALVGGAEVILVAGYGGVFVLVNPGNGRYSAWRKYGANFPNAIVTGLAYDPTDDILVAGTLGRSAWSLSHPADTLLGEPTAIIVYSQTPLCVRGWIAGSTVTFSAEITGSSLLTEPLRYRWTVLGASATTPLQDPKVTAVMPIPGTEVVILLVITDATGYQITAASVGSAISEMVASKRSALCRLAAKIRGEEIFNPFINPLGPDTGPDLNLVWPTGRWGPAFGRTSAGGLPDYAFLQRLMSELAEITAELERIDRVTESQPALRELSAPAAERRRRLQAAVGRIEFRFGPSDADPPE